MRPSIVKRKSNPIRKKIINDPPNTNPVWGIFRWVKCRMRHKKKNPEQSIEWTTAKIERYFLWLLQQKEYSQKELKSKAFLKKIPSEMAESVLEKIQSFNYQSDERCARSIVRSKVAHWGPMKIKAKLREKGLSDDIEQEVDWVEQAVHLLRKKFHPDMDLNEKWALSKRLVAKGFQYDTIREAFSRLGAEVEVSD